MATVKVCDTCGSRRTIWLVLSMQRRTIGGMVPIYERYEFCHIRCLREWLDKEYGEASSEQTGTPPSSGEEETRKEKAC